jgi:hypothetical protein
MIARKQKRTRKALNEPLVVRQQLKLLGSVLEEVARHYVIRLQRELQDITAQINQSEKNGRLHKNQIRDLHDMRDLISELHVKSERGRRKDLKKIDALIGKLQSTIDHWQ